MELVKGVGRRFECGIEEEIELLSEQLCKRLSGPRLQSIHETLRLQQPEEAPPPAKKARRVDGYWRGAVGKGIR